jgi:hypothetical protein
MKAILNVGYKEYVVEAEEAVAFIKMLSTAERYASKYKARDEGGTTYHIWGEEEELDSLPPLTFLSPSQYRLYKMAGKPPEL